MMNVNSTYVIWFAMFSMRIKPTKKVCLLTTVIFFVVIVMLFMI